MPLPSFNLRVYLGRLLLRWAVRLLLPAQRVRVGAPGAPLDIGASGAIEARLPDPIAAAPRPKSSGRSPAAGEQPTRADSAPEPRVEERAPPPRRAPLARWLSAARAWTDSTRSSARAPAEGAADAPALRRASAPVPTDSASIRPPRVEALPGDTPARAPAPSREPSPPVSAAATRAKARAEIAASRPRARLVRVAADGTSVGPEPAESRPDRARDAGDRPRRTRVDDVEGARPELRRATRAADPTAVLAATPRILRAEHTEPGSPRDRSRPGDPAHAARAFRPRLVVAEWPSAARDLPAAPVAPQVESVARPRATARRGPSLPDEVNAAVGDPRWPSLPDDAPAPDRHLEDERAARHAQVLRREQRGGPWSE